MTKPLLAILSQRPQLVTQLPDLLHDAFEMLVCDSVQEAERLLTAHRPGYFVADFNRPQFGGHLEDRLLEEILHRIPDMRVVMLTGDRCPEPLERRSAANRQLLHLRGEVQTNELAQAVREQLPIPEVPKPEEDNPHQEENVDTVLHGITRRFETNSPRMKATLAELEIAARHDVTILLIGETGSGKTFLSKLIHEVSPRRDEPFLHVPCGALPSELIESELFGHVKGAFTSAHADKQGKFMAAGRGTVLLDEIDVLGAEQQVKLLRAIETGEFEPVGSNQTLKSQARLVVASNLKLEPLVAAGKFRPDLYYRLNMLKFEITPLRDRPGDITPLARKFIHQHAQRHQVEIKRVDRSLLEALLLYPWPGNVRELEHVLQRAVIYCQDGILTSRHLPGHILARHAGPTNDPSVILTSSHRPAPVQEDTSLNTQIEVTEKEIIEQALLNNNFSRTKTARELGISRVTLYNKMKKYGM